MRVILEGRLPVRLWGLCCCNENHMLPGIFRLVNISRSAAFLFRYCNSSCASSSYFEKIHFLPDHTFSREWKIKRKQRALLPSFSGFQVECVLGSGKGGRVGPGTCFQITRWDKWWETTWVCPGAREESRKEERGRKRGCLTTLLSS